MLKSLQSKMILVMFLFILVIILFSAIFSTLKIEQIYYRGFVEEMINTVSSFGLNISNVNETYAGENKNIINELEKENIEKIINNFRIYFSLNNNSRYGSILDKDLNILYSSETNGVSVEENKMISELEATKKEYCIINESNLNEYYFIYFIRDNESKELKNIIMIEQSKEYINTQLQEVTAFYGASVVVILFITIIVSLMLASNVTKPIEMIREKAEAIAKGNIEEIELEESQKAGYEVSRLVDSFNLMIRQIKNNLNEISSEKSKLETILLHLTDGVLAFNTQGKLIHANLAAKKMLKIEKETLFEEIFKKINIDINMEKIMYLDDWTTTEQMIKIDDMFVNIFFATFRDEEDRPGGLVAVIHDITKQAKLDDMRKEFVANVSHELKTPLTSIKTYTETLLDQDLDVEDKVRFLNVILTEANRMTRLVSDLLQLTKFDYKKIAWNKIYFDLPELVKQICEKHKIQADSKNQILDCYVTSNVPMVFADRDGMEQVITNILTNSIKYTPEEGNIKVYVGSVHDDAYIKIIDNGMGIPEEDLPRVFERFYRVDKARSREMGGTGLGLPIAKEIIEANGGSIDMKSQVNKGTEVIMKIPCK
ncbi:MAG: ATP-binding protein [Clostridia bacterium]|nr:ATP-binding protein [Clostridia bacterium]